MTIPDRRTALAGESFKFPAKFLERFHVTSTFVYMSQEFSIVPKGEGNSGEWVCISCGYPCQNQIDMNNHCRKPKAPKAKQCMIKVLGEPAKHVLAWHSFISGAYEVP